MMVFKPLWPHLFNLIMGRVFLTVVCLTLFGLGIFQIEAEAKIAVIVHKDNSVREISLSELSKIYEGRQTSWKDGSDIIVVNRPPESDIRKTFYRVVLNSEPTQQFFQPGNPTPFRALVQKSDLATKRLVANMPNAIGYIDSAQVDDTVKVTTTIND